MDHKEFKNAFLRVLVPNGWLPFHGIDSDGKETQKKLHIYKDAAVETDIFTKAGITVCHYGKDQIYLSPKAFYDDARDLEPFDCGRRWEGYTCSSFGYPYIMLTSYEGEVTLQVMILTENGENKICLTDPDVTLILESLTVLSDI